MRIPEPLPVAWHASLALEYARRGERTVLAARRHDGPLVVQRPLYPEGEGVCHTIVVHPPAGVAGGDELEIAARVGPQAHALLTTPGAGRWYRSAGAWARQRVVLTAHDASALEWLPQETIVFDGALAQLGIEVRLEARARFIGWDILCFGRTASGERYARGECRLRTEVTRDGVPLWVERGRIAGGGALLASPVGLHRRTVCGTLFAASAAIDAEALAGCRGEAPQEGEAALTLLPGILVARYLGDSAEAARHYFTRLWHRLRPAVCGREAAEPRIWST